MSKENENSKNIDWQGILNEMDQGLQTLAASAISASGAAGAAPVQGQQIAGNNGNIAAVGQGPQYIV